MISIRQNLSELERSDLLRRIALDCYLSAIGNMAHYAIELDTAITAPHRQHLSALVAELHEAPPEGLIESRATIRGLLRDYRDKAGQYLAGLRDQLSSTAHALREMVEALSQCDTDHGATISRSLAHLRETANSPEGEPVRVVVRALADTLEDNIEQMRKQHRFTVSQLQTEMRLLHNRIDSLESAAVTDESTKFSNRRFLAEYLTATPTEGACFLILKMRGLAEARARFGPAIAENVLATFGRRLRNTVPREAVIGRWNEEDFLAIVPASVKPKDGTLVKRFAEHLSMPYACMLEGKVVRVPIVVTAECLSFPKGVTSAQVQAEVVEAFQ
jgi:GGDEF domain-containing protein